MEGRMQGVGSLDGKKASHGKILRPRPEIIGISGKTELHIIPGSLTHHMPQVGGEIKTLRRTGQGRPGTIARLSIRIHVGNHTPTEVPQEGIRFR